MSCFLVLGTAMWGWTVSEEAAFDILDHYYKSGGRYIDTASNYPINGQPEDWQKAELWLARWLQKTGVQDLKIILKVGSVTNSRSPDHDLSKARLETLLQTAKTTYGHNLYGVMVHWDNRDSRDQIAETVEFFRAIQKTGLKIGLSGIRHPDLYADIAPDLVADWLIESKISLFSDADYQRYVPFHGTRRFLAYGISAGGVRLDGDYEKESGFLARQGGALPPIIDTESVRQILADWPETDPKRPRSLYELALAQSAARADCAGVIIGPRTLDQLDGALGYWAKISEEA
jgi:aryl-alcohol dehydrogenase-like predicted oxidoreductase